MTHPIRLIIQQPSLAKYRVPVFRELAKYTDIKFKLLYGSRPELPNVEAEDFAAEPVWLWQRNIYGQQVFWHSAQWSSATHRVADVLMLTWNPRYISLVPTLLRAKFQGIPTILWGHGYSKSKGWLRKKVRNSIAKLATALLLYNQNAANAFLDDGWNPGSVFVARNSLDQEPIRKARLSWLEDTAKLEKFRQEEWIGPGPNLLFVSRLDPMNRLDLLVRAMTVLADEFPSVELFVIGKGSDEQHRLETLARSLGVAARLRFVGAIYDEMQLAPWFLSSQVFCYPANIGLSLLHAFGYGLPVVTSDNLSSQNPEIEALTPGVNGLFYKHNDVSALAAALRTIIADQPLAARMSAEAIRVVEEEFALPKMVAQMAAAVRFCAEKRK